MDSRGGGWSVTEARVIERWINRTVVPLHLTEERLRLAYKVSKRFELAAGS